VEREISAAIAAAILGYVERVLGDDGPGRVLAAAGMAADDVDPGDPLRWMSWEETVALADAAAGQCHDPDIGRRVGEEMVRQNVSSGVVSFIRSAGSIAAALPNLANAGSKMAASRRLRVVEVDDVSATLEAEFLDPADAHRFFCGIVLGYYSSLPSMFGTQGAAVEVACQCEGAPACRFRLVWDGEPAGGWIDGDDLGRTEVLLERFEQLQDTATDLAAAEDVTTVLSRIVHRAAVAVQAPRYLLAVRPTDGADVRVYQDGWAPDDVEAVTARMERGEVAANELVVPVESGDTHYGILAAAYAEGTEVNEVEHRLLASYARHAAAALRAAAALESARQDRDTASALLGLAHALSEVTSQEDLVTRLAEVVPAVVGADHSWIWMWDDNGKRLELAATSASMPIGTALEGGAIPGLAEMAADPRPMMLQTANEAEPVRRHMEAAGVSWGAVVPIAARGTFLGVIAAGFVLARDGEDENGSLVERLRGLASQAAAAIDNARLLDHIRDQALSDPLTGLPNRPLIEDRSNQALRNAARTGRHAGVLFIDLDRFKIVNDTLGHAAGDRLVCLVAERLAGCLRASDTLARLGGDEFVVLLPDLADVPEATAAAQRVVDAMQDPFDFDGRSLYISCSIGVAVSGHHGDTYAELLQHADAAMYEAKAQGRNTFEVRPARPMALGYGMRAGGPSQLDLETQLHRAEDRGELVLMYQPQVDFATMRIVAVEALLRWEHPTLGRLGPDAFLPVAEESGVIVGLDRWVRETAFAQAAEWAAIGHPLRMAVNVSTRDLRRPALCDEIEALLASSGLPASSVELEITDRVVMSEDALPQLLRSFSEIGVRLAIDDFGTGTSVIARLQRCPIDVLKIDKSFVQTITPAAPDAPVVSALLQLARSLRLEVVAEGVETAFQAGFLRRAGCSLAQGYFFSPPVPADTVFDLLTEAQAQAAVL
jgi:diguanylate cyclase (GGDEF)-like protein